MDVQAQCPVWLAAGLLPATLPLPAQLTLALDPGGRQRHRYPGQPGKPARSQGGIGHNKRKLARAGLRADGSIRIGLSTRQAQMQLTLSRLLAGLQHQFAAQAGVVGLDLKRGQGQGGVGPLALDDRRLEAQTLQALQL